MVDFSKMQQIKKGLGWKSGPVFKIQYPMKNRGKDTNL
jgi:hypothetical protein